jgi:hypothetical protein
MPLDTSYCSLFYQASSLELGEWEPKVDWCLASVVQFRIKNSEERFAARIFGPFRREVRLSDFFGF